MLTRDGGGNLYGTTLGGGTANSGVVYKLGPGGNFTVLYNFPTPGYGTPYSGVVLDSAGNLYGTTTGVQGAGTVYKLDPAGHYTLLYAFPNGGLPWGGVIRDASGNLYGTTATGGPRSSGVVYELDSAGHYRELHAFSDGLDGAKSYGSLIRDKAGNLYGTANEGGTGGKGVVFMLDPAGNYTVLYNFTGGADGGNPFAGVVTDASGGLYGTAAIGGTKTSGVMYKLNAR